MSKATENNSKNERWNELAARPVTFSVNAPDPNAPEWCPVWCSEQAKKDEDPSHVPHPVSALSVSDRRCSSHQAEIPVDYVGYRVSDGDRVHMGRIYVQLTQRHGTTVPAIDIGDNYFNVDAEDPYDMRSRLMARLPVQRVKELVSVLQAAIELAESGQGEKA